jgi:rfaE bifunctional protein nucleotidyltransferase chain/domain
MIVTQSNAIKIAQKLKKQGKVIVTTNGAFDILHIGHARYLKEARKMGDVLIVGVNSDKSPHFKSKPGRPIVPGNERVEMLDFLKPVDYVFQFDGETPNKWVEKIRPDIHVKACDSIYGIEQCVERFAVQKAGGKVVLIPKTKGKSTTNVVNKVLEVYANDRNSIQRRIN